MLAEDVQPDIDLQAQLAQIEAMATTLRARVAEDAFAEQKLAALNYYLFEELGFCGNVENYYDPRNAYLHEVLARRTGMPITLGILYIELGRRVGLNLQGVAFPGHFLVSLRLRQAKLLLDPCAATAPEATGRCQAGCASDRSHTASHAGAAVTQSQEHASEG
jgi:regulator of sirC expression with transglutaminase-like and TPR domain